LKLSDGKKAAFETYSIVFLKSLVFALLFVTELGKTPGLLWLFKLHPQN